MKIQSSINTPSTGTGAVSDRQAPAKPAAAGTTAVPGASVTLSDLSAHIAAGVQGTDFDQAKVESIKQAIAEGKLQVNAGAVADRLIANALALSGSHPK